MTKVEISHGAGPMSEARILFVCLGNICRSPTAHGVFEQMVQAEQLSHVITVDSAGTGDWHVGRAPDERAVRAARGRGYDLSHLRARQVRADDFGHFDYILAMDRANLLDLERLAPVHFSGTLGLFLDYARALDTVEVPDPYGGGMDGFERVLALVENASLGLLEHLKTRHKAG